MIMMIDVYIRIIAIYFVNQNTNNFIFQFKLIWLFVYFCLFHLKIKLKAS